MRTIDSLEHLPEKPLTAGYILFKDVMTNGQVCLVPLHYIEQEGWKAISRQEHYINGQPVKFPHYRNVVFNATGKWPTSDVLCDIKKAVLDHMEPGSGFVAHVSDYNYAPCLVLHGFDGHACVMRAYGPSLSSQAKTCD